MNVRKLELADCQVSYSCAPDDEFSGLSDLEAGTRQEIEARLASGHWEAWCSVTATVSWGQWSASASIFGCVLETQSPVAECEYHDLASEALDDLNDKISLAVTELRTILCN